MQIAKTGYSVTSAKTSARNCSRHSLFGRRKTGPRSSILRTMDLWRNRDRVVTNLELPRTGQQRRHVRLSPSSRFVAISRSCSRRRRPCRGLANTNRRDAHVHRLQHGPLPARQQHVGVGRLLGRQRLSRLAKPRRLRANRRHQPVRRRRLDLASFNARKRLLRANPTNPSLHQLRQVRQPLQKHSSRTAATKLSPTRSSPTCTPAASRRSSNCRAQHRGP